jgi:hypothetical protein
MWCLRVPRIVERMKVGSLEGVFRGMLHCELFRSAELSFDVPLRGLLQGSDGSSSLGVAAEWRGLDLATRCSVASRCSWNVRRCAVISDVLTEPVTSTVSAQDRSNGSVR